MSRTVAAVRKLLLSPRPSSVGFAARGFHPATTPALRELEAIPRAVVTGFEWGVEDEPAPELELRLESVRDDLRGFAYEGATMAAVVLDAMGGFRGARTRTLMAGPGRPHIFLTYIGIGFAMARLPRPLWRGVLPDLDGVPYHPTMSWLAVDGYAFDRAYFDTRRWVDEQHVPQPYPWQGRPDYFPRAVDQGVGRALWFVHGASVTDVAAAVQRFPAHRHADLWSGVGLAAAFAGGAARHELAALCAAAGPHRRHLGLGSVFAATARTHSGVVPEHTGVVTRAFTGLDVPEAAELAAATAVDPDRSDPGGPAYELWRAAIREALPEVGSAAAAA